MRAERTSMKTGNRNRGRENKLSFALIMIWRHKFWILFSILMAFVILCVYTGLHAEDSAKATLGLRYELAYEGLNPNGSRFNINELMSDEVLSQAIEDAGLKGELSTNQLQNCISISSAGSQDPKKMYIATEYSVEMTNKYLPERISARSMLNLVMQCYKNYFLDHYGRNDGVLDIDWSEVDSWEYLEFADIMEVKINNIIAYLETMQTESGTYNYRTEGETFRSLQDSVAAFRDIYLNKFTAYITNNNLFRDPMKYRGKLEYRRFLLSQTSKKDSEMYTINQDALGMYDKAMITFVMIPMYDEVNGMQMTRTETGMDLLTESSMTLAKTLEAHEQELKVINGAIARTYLADKDQKKHDTANSMIQEMEQSLNALIQRILYVVHDYEESRYKNSISYSIATDSVMGGYKVKRNAVLALIVGLLVCVVEVTVAMARKEEEKDV